VAGTFLGDGSQLINTPGPTTVTPGTPADNRIITFTSTSGKSIQGEENLTFDGSTLSVTGQLTASVGVSASTYYGDGSNLTGIAGGGGGGAVGSQGPVGALQFHTASTGISGSANLIFYTGSVAPLSSYLFLSGGIAMRRTAVGASPYTASASDFFLGVDTTAAAISIELDTSRFEVGAYLIIKDEGGNANANNITLSASASTIDGTGTMVIESAYAAVNVYTNGTSWFIF
jgi:hypothetical protein